MTVKIVLRNPLKHSDQVDYTILPADNALAQDWISALKTLLQSGNLLEKNFCFMGFPNTSRTLDYLCNEANQAAAVINNFFDDYKIEETYSPGTVATMGPWSQNPDKIIQHVNHDVLNRLHNHFEVLQGTVSRIIFNYK